MVTGGNTLCTVNATSKIQVHRQLRSDNFSRSVLLVPCAEMLEWLCGMSSEWCQVFQSNDDIFKD